MMRHIALIVLPVAVLMVFSATQAGENNINWPGSSSLNCPRTGNVIDSDLNAKMNLSTAEQFHIWVFFTDKGIVSQGQYLLALQTAQSKLTGAARERRLKSRGADNLVDFRDLPLYNPYVQDVLGVGVSPRQTLRWFNAMTVSADKEQIIAIANFPFVRLIKEVAGIKADFNTPLVPIVPDINMNTLDYGGSQGQINQINVVPAHELGFKGQGVIVCMMDVGYKQDHQAFQPAITDGRLLAQWDFINHDGNTDYDPGQDAPNQADHGTLTWSTLGGEAAGQLYGPSYLSSFILAKTEDVSSERHIEEDNWAAGAEWADSIGASVISSSLGYRIFDSGQGDYQYSDLDGNTAIVTIAADLAAYNGITVCNAMGNEGYDGAGSLICPADADSILSCGAVDASGYLAGFSSWGPTYDGRIKPEVCAQGQGTVCADPYNMNGYTTASGTSLSTPLVGGAAGLLLSAHPNWTPMMVREALLLTADRFDAPDNDYGWGIMDVSRALYAHPQGDIIIDYRPPVYLGFHQPLTIAAEISGGAGIDSASVFYRVGDIGDFTELPMNTGGDDVYIAELDGNSGIPIYYYLKVADSNGACAYWPLGGANHPFVITPGAETFADSFDHGLNYWTTGGANSFWGLTNKYARTGNISITDSPTTDYRDNASNWMESAFWLDLSNVSTASLSFYYRGVLQSGRDSLLIEASTDNGSSWSRINPGITGSYFNFTHYTASLSSYAGQANIKLRFHLVTDGSTRREGIYLDDISITQTHLADIAFAPVSITDSLAPGENRQWPLDIENRGNAALFVNLTAQENLLSNTWLFISPSVDTINPGGILTANITLDAAALTQGAYQGRIEIVSNDPDSPTSSIPVYLVVSGGPACQYTPGDANDNGVFNGIDVSYMVNYLKGVGAAPPYTCDCPPNGIVYTAADANGNCAFNGIDVSFSVNFLKGVGAAPSGCADCPPVVSRAASGSNIER